MWTPQEQAVVSFTFVSQLWSQESRHDHGLSELVTSVPDEEFADGSQESVAALAALGRSGVTL